MSTNIRDEYLASEVMTAPPQKLKLMLIEAAIRIGGRARQHWELDQNDQAAESLSRCKDIVSELIGGLSNARETELGRRLSAIYVFVFRCFVDAQIKRDAQKLADALRILEIERETWREVCAQLGTTRSPVPPPHGFGPGHTPRMSFEA